MQIHFILSRALIISLFALLASCSSKQTVSTSDASAHMIEEISTEEDALSAQQHIALAKTSPPAQAVTELLLATKLLYKDKNFVQALWLADKVIPMVEESTPNHIQEKITLSLIKASSLQQLDYFAESGLQLEQLAAFAQTKNTKLSATYYRLLQALHHHNNQPLSALNAQLYSFKAISANSQNIDQITSIWTEFTNLSQWQLSLLKKDNAPYSQGWIELTILANKFSGNQEQLNYQVTMWQNKHKHHPANVIAKQLKEQILTPKSINNIAVILPLSGSQKAAGLVIQQGILASFHNEADKKIHFIDSNTVNWYGLTNDLSILKADYVIGPLLKSNVDKYIEHTSLASQSKNKYLFDTSSNLFNLSQDDANNAVQANQTTNYLTPPDYNTTIDNNDLNTATQFQAVETLLLNIPKKGTLTGQHTVLSMLPEDEAKQAAATLSKKSFQHPIVLSQQDAISKRIAQAFVQQWQVATGDKINIVYYDTGSKMQSNIKQSLAVDQSQTRINTLKRRLNKTIKTQTRNRRDIDMIYLVGNPQQTRLVKPYIEVNISPFADIIPVYASSRSHSSTVDFSSNSDLQGLNFTEIPWLLIEKQDVELASLSKSLWPKRSDALSRLFAMGFDSYQLINKIPLMKQAPYLQHWGQTGVLKLGENNILTRSLFWGEYQRDKVVSVAME